jgi:hypothetical protein
MFGGHSQQQQPVYVQQAEPKKHGIGLGSGLALGNAEFTSFLDP